VARAAILEEHLEVLLGLLSGELVDHAGPHYRIDQVRFHPAPHNPAGIPIWMAARWPNRAPVRRAARYDGLFIIQCEKPDQLDEVRRLLEDCGAPEGFDLVVNGGPDADPQPWAEHGATWWLTQLGPYDLDLDEVRRTVTAGPRR